MNIKYGMPTSPGKKIFVVEALIRTAHGDAEMKFTLRADNAESAHVAVSYMWPVPMAYCEVTEVVIQQ